MKTLTTLLFLVFFILTGVLVGANTQYIGEFFFMTPIEGKSLALPFLGFTCLGIMIGIFFLLSIKYMFLKAGVTDIQKSSEE